MLHCIRYVFECFIHGQSACEDVQLGPTDMLVSVVCLCTTVTRIGLFFFVFCFVREVGKGREEGRGRIVDDMYVVTHVKDIVPMCMCEVCED